MSQAEEGFTLKLELEDHGYKQFGLINIDKLGATIERIKNWRTRTIQVLEQIFPRAYEARYFHCANIVPPSSLEIQNDQDRLRGWKQMIMLTLQNLEKISDQLDKYTDLPLQTRVYVEDIESFSKVRDINPECVRRFLNDGRIDLEEDKVQHAIENILGETFHKNDHGGEINDLSTHVKFCGKRRAAAFLLKGRGTKSKEMQIADCGSNGDQIVKLFRTSADLYAVQFIGPVSDNVVADVQGKVDQERSRGKDACYCIINGTDTARLLFAYGFLGAE
jgi:hypothetical protein